jgi:hypothetical protein
METLQRDIDRYKLAFSKKTEELLASREKDMQYVRQKC